MIIRTASTNMSAKDWFDRGYDLKRAGDLAGALNAFRNSIRCNPRAAAPWIGLAQVLEANGQFEDARECLRQACRASPGHLHARLQLAHTHKNLGYVDDARREYAAVLASDPNSAPAHLGLGQLFEDLGEPQAAAESYRAALKSDPETYDALANLLGLGRHVDVSHEIKVAQAQIRTEDLRKRAALGYGLGRALDRQQSYAAAFDAFTRANDARRTLFGAFDRAAFDLRIESIIDIFSAQFFSDRQRWGDPTERPIFVIGLPRSGTTLTEQIVASHPQCFGAGELDVLADLSTGAPDRLGSASPPWPRCAPDLSQSDVAAIGRDYLAASSQRAPDTALRVVDKQPLNFWHVGLVAIALPNARIIHCTRDIRDCGFSIYAQNFSAQQNWSTDLDDIVYYWRGYRRLMDHWEKVSGLTILDFAYEDTVSDLGGQAQRLLDFVELPWDDRTLQFHENSRAVQTPSRWQVRQPLYQTSMARWRHYARDLGPLIDGAAAGW